ncbi:MAG TPA: acyl carrier protein [Desulfurivibrio alkaliphilus]|uniref:Acyl carrier protein n=1 Tax=Desulfurivibrio alkaliphilus TaxID=427923 RepID=A0A7C2TI07_9BACT|nr:acyl carrier protein [Desulfurivibrio alkaliphilus]
MMSNDELRRRVVATLAEELELDPEALTPEATLYDDLGLDSLDAVDMVVALEKSFGMKFNDEESLKAVRTVNDLFELLIKLKESQTADEA